MAFDPQQILDAIKAGIIVVDSRRRVVYINDTTVRKLSLKKSQRIGAPLASISNRLDDLLARTPSHRFPLCYRHLRLNEGPFNVEISLLPCGGEPPGAMLLLRQQNVVPVDPPGLTEQDYLQLQFDTAFNFANIGMWIVNGRGVVLKVNPAAERLIGVTEKEVIGKKITDLEARGVIDQALSPHIMRSRKPLTRLLHVLKTDKYVMASGMPVFDRDGCIVLIAVNELDITLLKNLEGRLEKLRIVAEKYRDELSDLNLQDVKQHGLVAESKEMKQVLHLALKLAHLDVSNILLLGESGTGKGLIAQFIHNNSPRKGRPFVQINCAALPESLLEAELFGFEKGAFTGAATKGKIGLFEMAQNGTLLLDEIGELPRAVQSKLLKCLDDHEIMHIGGLKPININCTIIAATNRDLKTRVSENKFRPDLYHRLNAFHIQMPPLRSRPEDIVALADFYLAEYNRRYKLKKRFSLKAINNLKHYAFPGNVRELKNILKHAVVLSEADLLDDVVSPGAEADPIPDNVPAVLNRSGPHNLSALLDGFERSLLEKALQRCQTTRKMAAYLGTSQSRIARLMKKHRLTTKASNAPIEPA